MTTISCGYAEVETPGKTIYIELLDDPEQFVPAEFDPHQVAHDRNTCKTCAREIKVTAHLMSGFCAQVCREIFAEALNLYTEANATEYCEMCSTEVFVRDAAVVGTGWTDEAPDAPYVICHHCDSAMDRG